MPNFSCNSWKCNRAWMPANISHPVRLNCFSFCADNQSFFFLLVFFCANHPSALLNYLTLHLQNHHQLWKCHSKMSSTLFHDSLYKKSNKLFSILHFKVHISCSFITQSLAFYGWAETKVCFTSSRSDTFKSQTAEWIISFHFLQPGLNFLHSIITACPHLFITQLFETPNSLLVVNLALCDIDQNKILLLNITIWYFGSYFLSSEQTEFREFSFPLM